MNWFVFFVASAAVFRVTELVVYDKIFHPVRAWSKRYPFFWNVITCPYCFGMYAAFLATLYAHYLGYVDWYHFFGYILGLAGMQVVIFRSIRARD